MKKAIFTSIACAMIVLWTNPAWALSMEYYTYGGFDPVMQAFNRIALIFSDANYIGLYSAFTALGIAGGAIGALNSIATTGRLFHFGWIIQLIAGVVILSGLIIPRGNITIYDPVLNRFQTLGNIPNGIVAVAGTLNLIERGIVDIVDTSSISPSKYSNAAGGLGFKILKSVQDSHPHDSYLRNSLIRYTKDCVTFEIMRPGSTISLDDMRNSSTDLINEIGKAANMAVYTMYYDASAPEGTAQTCHATWASLLPVLNNSTTYSPAVSKMCGESFFDVSNSSELATCQTLAAATVTTVLGVTQSAVDLIKYRQISEILYNLYYQDDSELAPLMEASRGIVASGLGMGITMNEWIPIIKAVMTSIVLGVIPFLALLFPTPLLPKAIGTIFGFFVFLATWGVTDAVVHSAAIDYAFYAFEGVRQTSPGGVYNMAALPTQSNEILAMFGVVRGAGMMLAGLVSSMLTKFGGSMLAHLAGNLNSLVQSAGAKGGQLFTPDGRSASLQQMVTSAALLDGMREHNFNNLAGAQTWNTHKSVGDFSTAKSFLQHGMATGELPAGTNLTDLGQMVKGQMTAVTPGGTFSANMYGGKSSTMPAHSVMDSSTKADSLGFLHTRTTDSHGNGTEIAKSSFASLSYAVKNGHADLSTAQMPGLTTALNRQGLERLSSGQTHNIGTSFGSDYLWRTARQHADSDKDARSFLSSYVSNQQNAIRHELNDSTGSLRSIDKTDREAITAALDFGGRVSLSTPGSKSLAGASGSAGLSGRESFDVTTADGHRTTIQVSQATAKSLNETITRSDQQTASDMVEHSNQHSWMQDTAEKINTSDTTTTLDQSHKLRQLSSQISNDGLAPYIKALAQKDFGGDDTIGHEKATSAMNKMLRGTSGQQQALVDNIEEFYTNRGQWQGLADVDPMKIHETAMSGESWSNINEVDKKNGGPNGSIRTAPNHVSVDGSGPLDFKNASPEDIKTQQLQRELSDRQKVHTYVEKGAGKRAEENEGAVLGAVGDRTSRIPERFVEQWMKSNEMINPNSGHNDGINPKFRNYLQPPSDGWGNSSELKSSSSSNSGYQTLGRFVDKSANADPDLKAYAQERAAKYGVPFDYVNRLFSAESSWNQSAISPKDAVGLGQITPIAAQDIGMSNQDRYDSYKNIDGSVRYLKKMMDRYGNNMQLAYAAYNAGPGRVDKAGGRVPNIPETVDYVRKTTGNDPS